MARGVNKGDVIELTLDNLAHGGDCVGHLDRLAVFVPGGVPGERVRARIIQSKQNYARGRIIEVIEPAEKRIEPACPVNKNCGGCQLQHMDYHLQLIHKREMVRDLLQRVGGLTGVEVEPVIGADYPWAYRNKAQFPLTVDEQGQIRAGFYRKGTHQVVTNQDCAIQHPLLNRTLQKTLNLLNEYDLEVYQESTHRGLLRHLVIRAGVCTNQALLTIITAAGNLPRGGEIAAKLLDRVPELQGVLQNINPHQTNVILGEETVLLGGQDYIIDYIGRIRYAISPRSFFQVNTLQADKLYQTVRELAALSGEEVVVDAYCGIGSISLYLAGQAGRVYGIEEVEEAVADARRNARLNQIENCTFQTGMVEEVLPGLFSRGDMPDLVIFDPPRKGLDREVIKAVVGARPEKIVYVSCNPATLARDLRLLAETYRVACVRPVDMFPQTYHIETVTSLQRR